MNVVDLFSGCGGFAFGAHAVGFRVPVAFDIDSVLTSSYRLNYPETRLRLTDVRQLSADDIKRTARVCVDGLIGGPPCQGFSSIGLRDKSDPRRELLNDFFRLVREISPKFFAMENVVALANRDERPALESHIDRLSDRYHVLGPLVLDASDFGAATKRRRVFVIGIHRDAGDGLTVEDIERERRRPSTVRDAIADLVGAVHLGVQESFDVWRLPDKEVSRYARLMRSSAGVVTGHSMTIHSQPVVDRFKLIKPGEVDRIGRHPRLAWDGLCPTIRAGTGQDRGSFQSVRPIHPVEPRVITVREAARLQGFPDFFLFHPTTWHSFRMIGNSVSPFQSTAIFRAIRKRVTGAAASKREGKLPFRRML